MSKSYDGIVFHGGGGGQTYRLWFDLDMCSEVVEDGPIEQNIYDFLLVFYSNSVRATVNFMPK